MSSLTYIIKQKEAIQVIKCISQPCTALNCKVEFVHGLLSGSQNYVKKKKEKEETTKKIIPL